jgi:hypothetical protein
MGARGPKPAESHTRARNDKKAIALVSDGKQRGIALPQLRIGGKVVAWHPRTVAWWNAWRKSPQALRMMTEPDWQYLLVTARVHHEFWSSGRWELAAELRLREKEFGATPEARARMGVEIGVQMPTSETGTRQSATTSSSDSATVTQIDPKRRQRVAGA